MIVLRITTSNVLDVIDIDPPIYEGLNQLIGDFFEIVRSKGLEQPYVMIVDKRGLLKNLPYNCVGSALYGTPKHGNPIAGDIVIMREELCSDGYDLAGLDGQDIPKLINYLNDVASRYVLIDNLL